MSCYSKSTGNPVQAVGKIVKSDVSIAKNYLTKEEMQDLNHFVTMYLDYAER